MFFFLNDTATTEIYTLPLHDALPISDGARRQVDVLLAFGEGQHHRRARLAGVERPGPEVQPRLVGRPVQRDRKSTRLNSSHANISYAVFCLKKKNFINITLHSTVVQH